MYNNLLYAMDKNGSNIVTYNTLTDIRPRTIQLPNDGVGNKACLTANDDYLFVTCTSSGDGRTYIYDLNRSEWLDVYPYVPTDSTGYIPRRYGCGCVIVDNWLYTLGGAFVSSDPDYGTYESTTNLIGKLDISGDLNASIASREWQGRGGSRLPVNVNGARAVAFGQWIFLVGGYKNARVQKWKGLKQVWVTEETVVPYLQIVDTHRGDTAIGQWDALNYAVKYASPIIFDRKLYVFGGNDGSNTLDSYQYIELMPTASPTNAPTVEPTHTPTLEPTLEPTKFPSVVPSKNPTMEPTLSPTDPPSTAPTAWLSDAKNVATVSGVSVAAVVVLVLCIVGAFCLGKRRQTKKTEEYGLMNNDVDDDDEQMAYQAL